MKIRFTRIQIMASFILFLLGFAGCSKPLPPAEAPYDLDVKLSSNLKSGHGEGFVKFRQDKDTARIINLDTWVQGLAPNRSYQLQRAANPGADADCTSTAWLTLGEGLQPLSIQTDKFGNGSAPLWRDVTAIARGTSFRIHFQIIDAVTTEVVLTSDCYFYTVR